MACEQMEPGVVPTLLPAPLTIGEYLAIGETEVRTELQEGSLVLIPSPGLAHAIVRSALLFQLAGQVPPHLAMMPGVDVDLALVAADEPGTSRCPDVIVIDRSVADDLVEQGDVPRGSDLRLAVEVVSPGSRRMDTVVKRREYANAGVQHYWIVDVEPAVSLVACRLRDGVDYDDRDAITDVFTTTEPFEATIDVAALLDDWPQT